MKTFVEFLNESETVKIDRELREYTLSHKNEGIFDVRSSDFYRQFNVTPYKSETIESIKTVYDKLVDSIDTLNVNDLYSAVDKAEKIPYTYGNVFSGKFDLKIVPDLVIELQPEQVEILQRSQSEFLVNIFSQLNKNTKDLIIGALRERAEILCVVIEALFYYIRTVDTENYYKGMNSEEILEEYDEAIKKASKESYFSFEGPFSSATRNPVEKDTTTAIWLCKKDMKDFMITATISPKALKSEDNIGDKGLKFTLTTDEKTLPKDFNFFDIEELASRIKLFNDKILQK